MSGAGGLQVLMYCVLTDGCAKEKFLDVNILRGSKMGVTDIFLAKVRVKVGGGLKEGGNDIHVKEELKVSEFEKVACVQIPGMMERRKA